MNTVDTINIKTLLFFIEVFDAQSFSVVARKEGVSASKVSRIIKQLEVNRPGIVGDSTF